MPVAPRSMNPKIVGKPASAIAELAGLGPEAEKAKVLLARESEVGVGHPFSGEKLCPILALYEIEDETAALALSCAILHHEGSGHTFSIHAEDDAVVRRFAKEIPVSRFLVNTPAALGGIGATTNLFPALTLGCGAVGGSSSSNNIGPLDLINIRRVAWGVREPQEETTVKSATVPAVDEALLAAITARLMEKLN